MSVVHGVFSLYDKNSPSMVVYSILTHNLYRFIAAEYNMIKQQIHEQCVGL